MAKMFDNFFEITKPLGSDYARDLDIAISANTKGALNERLSVEHYDLSKEGPYNGSTATGASQGRHIPGMVGVLGWGTPAERNALTDPAPGIGAIWVITEEDTGYNPPLPSGTTFRYTFNGWIPTQLASGTIYATAEQVNDGAVGDRALNPKTHFGYHNSFALFEDRRPFGVDGQSSDSSKYIKRELTETENNIVDCSFSNNIITLPAGIYKIQGYGVASRDSSGGLSAGGSSKAAIFEGDVDDVTKILLSGTTVYSAADDWGDVQVSHIFGVLTLTAETEITLRHRVSTSNLQRLGSASSLGGDEVYASLMIEQLKRS